MTATHSPEAPMSSDRLVTLAYAAEILSVHPSTIRRAIRAGQIEGVRCWRSLRVRLSDLDRWVAEGITAAR